MFDVRRGEGGRALLAFTILFLVLGAYTAVKAVRDAVFLSRFGVTEISFVAIGLAIVSGVVVALFLRATAGLERHWLITLTHGVIAATLVGLWAALGNTGDGGTATWVPWALYVWSSLFGVFIVMQFWLLAAELFDVREAKRLFGLVGTGAILGALAGGLIAKIAADHWSARALLLIAAAMLVGAAALAHVVWPQRASDDAAVTVRPVDERPSGIMALVTTPSLLRFIALSLLLSTVATTLIDWQVKAIAKHVFDSQADAMASFFGLLFAWQSIAALVVQVLLTGWILRRFGLAVGRMVLPIAVFAGSLAIVGHNALAISMVGAAGFAKVAEGGLRFAVDKATTELTWLPVPSKTREATKSFIDTVFDRLGTGVTGVIWLVLAAFGFDQPAHIHRMSIVVIGLVVLWLLVLRAMHASYVDAFRTSLASRSIDLESLRAALGDDEAARTVGQALGSRDADQVLFGLYLLEDSTSAFPDVSVALAHEQAEVRERALTMLGRREEQGYGDQAQALLIDDDHAVREAAIVYLRRTGAVSSTSSLASDRATAAPMQADRPFGELVVILGDPTLANDARRHIQHRLVQGGAEHLSNIQLLGAAPASEAATLLRPLIDDDDDATRAAAIRAAGRAAATELVPHLAKRLQERRWRARTVTALADMGPEATMELVKHLQSPELSAPAKMAIIRLAGASEHAPAARQLESLLSFPGEIAVAAARALGRLRLALGDRVILDAKLVEARLTDVAGLLYRRLLFLDRGSWPLCRKRAEGVPETPMTRAVREAADAHVRHIFALLSLIYAPADIRSATRGVSSPLRAVRARSLEFLDNLLKASLRDLILPTLEELDAGRLRAAAVAASAVSGAAATTKSAAASRERDALLGMLSDPDPWLSMVACWTLGERRMQEARATVEQLARKRDALGEVARRALERFDGHDDEPSQGSPRGAGSQEMKTPALTQVEKALKLRAVDVLKQAASEDLAYVAQIASEMHFEAGEVVYREDDVPDALYVVIQGEVELTQGDVDIGIAEAGEAFGSWALVDGSPRVASATAASASRVLKVDREDFTDLLADRPDIVQAVFKAMVGRIRNLAALARGDADG